jgi:hypothetical protein
VRTIRRARLFPDRRRGGLLAGLLLFLLVVAALAALAWMLFLPVLLTQQLRARTGCGAAVERFAVNPVSGHVELRGLVLTNPPGFPAEAFVTLRDFTADADVASLFSARPVFDRVVVDIAEITLVKRADGTTNAEALEKALIRAPAGDPPAVASPAKSAAKSLLIRRLTVKIDRIVVADYTGVAPDVRTVDARVDRTYTDVTDLEELLGPSALGEFAPLGAIAERLIPAVVGRSVRDALRSGGEVLKEKGRKAEEKVRGLFDALEESQKP